MSDPATDLAWRPGPGGLDRLEIRSPLCEATVLAQGAQILSWVPHGAAPVLFTSPKAVYAPGKAVRGGVPVSFPWFAVRDPDPRPQGRASPSHGFARVLPWTRAEAVALPAGEVLLRFSLRETPETQALWPHAFAAELRLEIGRALTVALTVENCGETPFSFQAALHTYLALSPDVAARVEGLDGASCYDKRSGIRSRQTGDLLLEGALDRVYDGAGPVTLVSGERRLEIASSGATQVVVWRPGPDAATIADLGLEMDGRFACVEAANVAPVVLTPQETHALSQTLRLG